MIQISSNKSNSRRIATVSRKVIDIVLSHEIVVRFLIELAGWLGAGAILVAYFLNSRGVLTTGYTYQTLNLLGAAGVVANSVYWAAWPSVGLNAIWCVIALYALLTNHRTGSQLKEARE